MFEGSLSVTFFIIFPFRLRLSEINSAGQREEIKLNNRARSAKLRIAERYNSA
jgi:hypothetical protein